MEIIIIPDLENIRYIFKKTASNNPDNFVSYENNIIVGFEVVLNPSSSISYTYDKDTYNYLLDKGWDNLNLIEDVSLWDYDLSSSQFKEYLVREISYNIISTYVKSEAFIEKHYQEFTKTMKPVIKERMPLIYDMLYEENTNDIINNHINNRKGERWDLLNHSRTLIQKDLHHRVILIADELFEDSWFKQYDYDKEVEMTMKAARFIFPDKINKSIFVDVVSYIDNNITEGRFYQDYVDTIAYLMVIYKNTKIMKKMEQLST